ncbi:MAG: hypothetical protein AAF478_12855 [Pseudomonadota bacterium]
MLHSQINRGPAMHRRALPDCEQVMLDAMRLWARAAMSGEQHYLMELKSHLATFAGANRAEVLMSRLSDYLRSLDSCRPTPLRMYPKGAREICRDEALILSLVAGVQNGNESTIAICLDCLTCPSCSPRILQAAEILATYLSLSQKKLLPVDVSVMRDILTRDISTPTLQ